MQSIAFFSSGISVLARVATIMLVLVSAPVAVKAQERGIALLGGTLIDGNGGAPVRNSVILIRGRRIEAVGVLGKLEIPSAFEHVSTEGMTVLPGLWDLHVHL